jgi:excisionase family DNA binding protein
MAEHTAPQRRRYETLQSAAERLAVDTRTVRRWIAAGRLNAYRTGPRLIRLNVEEVDALLTPVSNFVSGGVPSGARLPDRWRFPA